MSDTSQTDKPAPHYLGHRQRLRERFLNSGADALADYEVLELILFRALPQGDVKPLAKALLDKFGGFAGVVNAPMERLMEVKGIKQAAAAEIKIVQAAALQMLQTELVGRDVISSWTQLVDYCKAQMGYVKQEQFRILFLDRKNVLIADEMQQQGTVDHTPVYPREVVKRALELAASAIILVHNHPSGDPTPSKADIDMTKNIARAAEAVGIRLHDHLVIGHKGTASFRTLGLI